MRPLLSRPVTRQNTNLDEWERSEHHLTDDGRAEFKARQMARIAAADKARAEQAKAKVQPITRKHA